MVKRQSRWRLIWQACLIPYPILRRLEAGALLTVHSVEHNGRLRKYYHITDAGRARIEEFKEEWKELESIYRFIVKEEVRDE